jgi:hypothetical protein
MQDEALEIAGAVEAHLAHLAGELAALRLSWATGFGAGLVAAERRRDAEPAARNRRASSQLSERFSERLARPACARIS